MWQLSTSPRFRPIKQNQLTDGNIWFMIALGTPSVLARGGSLDVQVDGFSGSCHVQTARLAIGSGDDAVGRRPGRGPSCRRPSGRSRSAPRARPQTGGCCQNPVRLYRFVRHGTIYGRFRGFILCWRGCVRIRTKLVSAWFVVLVGSVRLKQHGVCLLFQTFRLYHFSVVGLPPLDSWPEQKLDVRYWGQFEVHNQNSDGN